MAVSEWEWVRAQVWQVPRLQSRLEPFLRRCLAWENGWSAIDLRRQVRQQRQEREWHRQQGTE